MFILTNEKRTFPVSTVTVDPKALRMTTNTVGKGASRHECRVSNQ